MGASANPPSLPRVHAEDFEGPLDLLLEEVRRQRVAIENVAMAPIVASYLEYVRSAVARSANLHIEWLEMAATLIQWKSASLLPCESGPAADPIRDQLVRQLVAHRGRLAAELERREMLENKRFSRAAAVSEESPEAAWVTVWDLTQQAREMARWIEAQRELRKNAGEEAFGVEPDDVSVEEMIEYLDSRLEGEGRCVDGLALLQRQQSRARLSCLFLAMLELSRRQQLSIEQNEAFGGIALRRIGASTETCL